MFKVYPWLVLVCAAGLAAVSAYFSIRGLSQLFSGAWLAAVIMTGFLELSKVVLAAVVYSYWAELNRALKRYLVTAIVVISIITSIGVYGFLSHAYQAAHAQHAAQQEQVFHQEAVLQNYRDQQTDIQRNLTALEGDIAVLRRALSDNVIQYVAEDGTLVTTTSTANRRAYQEQLEMARQDQQQLMTRLEQTQANIQQTQSRLLDLRQADDVTRQLGPLVYLSRLTGRSMDVVVNYIILALMVVFDPLALSMVVLGVFALNRLRPVVETAPLEGRVLDEFENRLGPVDEIRVKSGFVVDVKNKRWRQKGRTDWKPYESTESLRAVMDYLKQK